MPRLCQSPSPSWRGRSVTHLDCFVASLLAMKQSRYAPGAGLPPSPLRHYGAFRQNHITLTASRRALAQFFLLPSVKTDGRSPQ
ncbi:MAG: hypothetical protein LBF85_03560 [Tannerella sp.]|nr:hypothetical protein [Tannerella sp.]